MMCYFMKNFEQLVVQKILISYKIKTSGKNSTLDFTTTRVCVYSSLVTKSTVRGAREMSLLFFFFEALRLPSVTSFLFLFTILGPVHAVHCG